MLIQLFVLTALVFLSLGQPKYQERNVYLSQDDNACNNDRDIFSLTINLDDQSTVKYQVEGMTSCPFYHLRYASTIQTSDVVGFIEQQQKEQVTRIIFNQVSTKKFAFGVLLSDLFVKTTVNNPVLIKRVNYNCTILGDGKIQHFGIRLQTPPAEIYMKCLSISQQQARDLQKKRNNLLINQQ